MRDSKITFRVSDDLLERVDGIDESRSEIMREALRSYLEGARGGGNSRRGGDERGEPARNTRPTFDSLVREMVEEAVDEAVERRLGKESSESARGGREGVNVTVNMPEGGGVEGRARGEEADADARRTTDEEDVGARKTCPQCGEEVDEEHVHCPNCGAKASGRVFCDCGDEVRTDWSFCPSCGRRTPTSHALSGE
jgi:hypothetical protein